MPYSQLWFVNQSKYFPQQEQWERTEVSLRVKESEKFPALQSKLRAAQFNSTKLSEVPHKSQRANYFGETRGRHTSNFNSIAKRPHEFNDEHRIHSSDEHSRFYSITGGEVLNQNKQIFMQDENSIYSQ